MEAVHGTVGVLSGVVAMLRREWVRGGLGGERRGNDTHLAHCVVIGFGVGIGC